MELKKIKEIMIAMTRNKTKRLRIKEGDFELELERECQYMENEVKSFVKEHKDLTQAKIYDTGVREVHAEHSEIPTSLHPPVNHDEHSIEKEGGQYVTSPMVGTFYLTPNPEDPPFVKEGDTVDKDSVVCIIEAMKVMNEVKASNNGTITKILVENGHPVEFGTKLFIISKKS